MPSDPMMLEAAFTAVCNWIAGRKREDSLATINLYLSEVDALINEPPQEEAET